jgi:ABC-type lipoprotein export system ATPase subunit
MIKNVFEINGLVCAYHQNAKQVRKVVLQIGRLDIPMGKLSVILGPSGSGKSTLIETLGLMNNTIEKGTIEYYHDDIRILINGELWRHQQELTGIRNRHFSFVFQNDFLMPYYSSEENMLIGKLIQDTSSQQPHPAADLNVFCRQMGLRFEEIMGKRPSELSVGQKQRLSFIRAMVKEYSVLFGDEPTGNLDEENSELLVDVLKRSIGLNGSKTAILVSHNIPLSVAKADFIILLSPAGEIYEVQPGHVFSRTPDGWLNGDGRSLSGDELMGKIRSVVQYSQPGQQEN